jgi:hypothetical protein
MTVSAFTADQLAILRASKAATVVSLLCGVALAIYALWVSPDTRPILVLTAPMFLFHSLSLYTLIRAPTASAVKANVLLAVFAFFASVLSTPFTIAIWVMLGVWVLVPLNLVYLACQIISVVRGTHWNASSPTP